MKLDSDTDDEIVFSWGPSPPREVPQPGTADHTKINPGPLGSSPESGRAPSPFAPIPARVPTPVRTLPTYYGSEASEQPQVKRPPRKMAKRKQTDAPQQRTLHNYYNGPRDGTVLIADLDQLTAIARFARGAQEETSRTPAQFEVTFRTRGQFETHFGRPPTMADMDKTCTMTSFEPGVLRSKPRTWNAIDVDEKDNWRDQYDERDQIFGELMDKVGQSAASFRKRHITGLLGKEQGKFKTPAGERRRYHAYLNKLQAGQHNPDVLIRLEDGSYKAVFLKLHQGTSGLTSFEEVTKKYGKDNVWLRTIEFDYMTHEKFDRYASTVDAAEKMFSEYTGRTYEPNVFVRVEDGKWISKKLYDVKNRDNFSQDLSKIEILILGEFNQGFLQPKTMNWQNSKLYDQRMTGAHLTGNVVIQAARGRFTTKPVCDVLSAEPNQKSAPVLMQVNRDEIIAIDRIPPGVEPYRIFPQNVSEKTRKYTGNYTQSLHSIMRAKKFAAARDDPHLQPANGPEKPKRQLTAEQLDVLRSPSPPPTDLPDSEVSVGHRSASLPRDASADEAPSSPVARRPQLSRGGSDDDMFVRQNSESSRSDSSDSDTPPRSRSTRRRLSPSPDNSEDRDKAPNRNRLPKTAAPGIRAPGTLPTTRPAPTSVPAAHEGFSPQAIHAASTEAPVQIADDGDMDRSDSERSFHIFGTDSDSDDNFFSLPASPSDPPGNVPVGHHSPSLPASSSDDEAPSLPVVRRLQRSRDRRDSDTPASGLTGLQLSLSPGNSEDSNSNRPPTTASGARAPGTSPTTRPAPAAYGGSALQAVLATGGSDSEDLEYEPVTPMPQVRRRSAGIEENIWPPPGDLGIYTHDEIVSDEKYKHYLAKVGLDSSIFYKDKEGISRSKFPYRKDPFKSQTLLENEEIKKFLARKDILEYRLLGNTFDRQPTPDRWPFLASHDDEMFRSEEYKLLEGSGLCVQSRFCTEDGRRVYIELSKHQAGKMTPEAEKALGFRFQGMSKAEFAAQTPSGYLENPELTEYLEALEVLRPAPLLWQFDRTLPLLASKKSPLLARSEHAVLPPDSDVCLAVNYEEFGQPTYARLNAVQAAQLSYREKIILGLRPRWTASLTALEQYKLGLLPPGSLVLQDALEHDREIREYFGKNPLKQIAQGDRQPRKEPASGIGGTPATVQRAVGASGSVSPLPRGRQPYRPRDRSFSR
ncbi:MAG: hypothetical protein EOR16_31935 [Mesorhizobium sp.]|uniref:hypothetical protein n=1 Tax=Mesorhizobium sp. TaxID=1871066 RepID=UPI000FE4C8B1|nr:hypothetical protein [Mesorhizobium sp.]RWI49119.1 MAG: hypothetical protein EOR16_31935 [Mesorhizobium sp.]